ncbi:MAG: hypothetical protein GYB66_02110 [Chloroflexi bacterium]|nr:hypothetical protein [Chloroflexota bacterium]
MDDRRIFAKSWQRWQLTCNWLMQGMILWIFFCAGWWWRPRWMLSSRAPAFIHSGLNAAITTDAYREVSFARFALVPFIAIVLILWALTFFRGTRPLLRDARLIWLVLLGGLVFWIWQSVGWAAENEAVARSQAAQWIIVFAFVVALSANGPAPRWIALALVGGMVFHAAIGITQSALQTELGIAWVDETLLGIGIDLYEYRLDPQRSGVSVIQADGIRHLRAYGITSHPNLLAGSLVMGLLASLWLWQEPRTRRVAAWVMVIGLWGLFLTFSRASVGGLIVGMGAIVGLWWLAGYWQTWAVKAVLTAVLLTGGAFYAMYHPLVNVRVGYGDEGASSLEGISVESRQVYLEQAETIIRDEPLYGIGIGNFPWVSHRMLRDDPRQLDLQGANVHRIYHLAIAEVGLIGGGLAALTLAAAGAIVLYRWRRGQLQAVTICLWGGILAWLAIGWFEFFPWVLFPYQIMFWGAMAAALMPATRSKGEFAMESIKLRSTTWQMLEPNENSGAAPPDRDDPRWQPVSLPLAGRPGPLWLMTGFIMPPNEHCATWWLETDAALSGAIWLNGQRCNSGDSLSPDTPLDITDRIAVGENSLILFLEQVPDGWQVFTCVPYACP